MTALGEIFPPGPEAAVGSRSSTVLGTGGDDSPTKSRQPGQCTIHQGPKEKSFVACRTCRGGLRRISILAGFAREILHSRWSRPRRNSQTTLVVQDRKSTRLNSSHGSTAYAILSLNDALPIWW